MHFQVDALNMMRVKELNGDQLMQLIQLASELIKNKYPERKFETPKNTRKIKKDAIQSIVSTILTVNRFSELSEPEKLLE